MNRCWLKEIRQLVEQIRKEIQYIRKADKSLLNEVKDIEKIAIDSLPEKPGIYHIRFLEIVLRTLQLLRQKWESQRRGCRLSSQKEKKRIIVCGTVQKSRYSIFDVSKNFLTHGQCNNHSIIFRKVFTPYAHDPSDGGVYFRMISSGVVSPLSI